MSLVPKLEKRFGFLVSDIARLFGVRFDRAARAGLELSRAQCRVALYLSTHGRMKQARLAELLDVTPMTTARMLDRMEEGGWVTRTEDPDDRRACQVDTTQQAEDALADALRLGDAVSAQALAGLTAAEKKVLIGLLQRIRGNLAAGD